jgi:hypothetical protein
MRRLLLISTALALSTSLAMACPNAKKNTDASAPAERTQSTASASKVEQSKPVQVATGEKDSAAAVAK